MTALPFLDARVPGAVGAALAPPGPALPPGEAAEVTASLREALAASVAPVAVVTELGEVAQGPMLVVDRASWIRANADMALTLLSEGAAQPWPAPGSMVDTISGRFNGAQLGGMLALLSTRILGQYLPFATEPKLVVVAPNVVKIERELGVDPEDFRLWVCLHEQTHRLQFAAAPWLRGHLLARVGELIHAEDAPRSGRPATLVEAVTTPQQQAVLAEVTAVMSLLEGYADDMMDRVGPDVVPSVAAIRATFDKRRGRGGWTKALNKLLAMDMKLAQYRDGARFCRAVIERVGVAGLNRVYAAPEFLPRPDDIADPARWVARVHG